MNTELEKQMQDVGMTELQLNAVMGSLMGDASFRGSGANTKAVRWNHGEKQLPYVEHKYRILSEFATKPPFLTPNPGYGNTWAVLTLKSLGVFHSLYMMTHPDGTERKTVTREFLENITHPIALAWWYMDDGSRRQGYNTGNIATNGFSREENELLRDWLLAAWGVSSTVREVKHSSTGNTGYNLYLDHEGFIRLMQLIAPYAPECMKYKTGLVSMKCAYCGKEIPAARSQCCSPACSIKWRKQAKHEYYMEHWDHVAQQSLNWRKNHRDLINQRARERYAQLGEEGRRKRNEAAKRYRAANPQLYKAIKKAYLERHKNDPDFILRKKNDCAKYYAKVKQDPERYAKRLALARIRRRRQDVKDAELLYQREYRKRLAADPEKKAAALERDRGYYRKYMADPVKHAKLNAKAKKQYQNRMARIKADPEAYEEYKRKAREAYYRKKANETPEQKKAARLKRAAKYAADLEKNRAISRENSRKRRDSMTQEQIDEYNRRRREKRQQERESSALTA